MMRVAGRLVVAHLPTWTAWAGSAASLALAACALPPSDVEARDAERRAHAYRHAQLALAYLGHARVDVAGTEIAAALVLAPTEASVRHAAALVDVAQGRHAAALVHFAAAVAAVDREFGASDPVPGGVSQHAVGARVMPGEWAAPREQRAIARTTLADARTLWSNYAQALCAVGKIDEAGHFFRRVSTVAEGAGAAVRETARPAVLDEAASQRQCRRAS